MKIAQADEYFNNVSVDGWNGSAWVSGIDKGNFLTYDRFLGPRTFGHKQRMLLVGGDGSSILPYQVIRTPNGVIYIVLSHNQDINGGGIYATNFLLQQAPYSADVIELQTTPAPSGIGGTVTPTTIATYHCDLERYTSEGSSEFDTVRYGIMTVVMQGDAFATINTEHELDIGGTMYEVKEVNHVLDGTELRVLKRGEG